jgi:hypothetical protein
MYVMVFRCNLCGKITKGKWGEVPEEWWADIKIGGSGWYNKDLDPNRYVVHVCPDCQKKPISDLVKESREYSKVPSDISNWLKREQEWADFEKYRREVDKFRGSVADPIEQDSV